MKADYLESKRLNLSIQRTKTRYRRPLSQNRVLIMKVYNKWKNEKVEMEEFYQEAERKRILLALIPLSPHFRIKLSSNEKGGGEHNEKIQIS